MKIRIDDTFCEWEYTIEGSDKYCIKDFLDAIGKMDGVIISEGIYIRSTKEYNYPHLCKGE